MPPGLEAARRAAVTRSWARGVDGLTCGASEVADGDGFASVERSEAAAPSAKVKKEDKADEEGDISSRDSGRIRMFSGGKSTRGQGRKKWWLERENAKVLAKHKLLRTT